jgi:two-component system, OmpR family, sensor kinase
MTVGRLFWKFFFSFLFVLIVVGFGVGTTVWLHQQHRLGPHKDIMGGRRAAFFITIVSDILSHDQPTAPVITKVLESIKEDHEIPSVYIVDEHDHELLGRTVTQSTLAHARHLVSPPTDPRIVRTVSLKNGHTYTVFSPKNGWSIDPPAPPAPSDLSSPFIFPIFFGMIASLACSAFLALYFSKPIRHLRWAMDTFSAGNLNIRVGSLMNKQRDEIADLGEHFDQMAQKIQFLIASQQRLLHDVSHELRSPLARIQAAIGLLNKQPQTLDQALVRIEREVEQFDTLIGELLTLSRLENGMRETSEEYFDLVELIQSIVEDARFETAPQQRSILFNPEGEVLLRGSAKLLYRAIENVIRNAIKYTPAESTIDINIEHPSTTHVLINIADSGFGIPEDTIESIFQPFFRGTASPLYPKQGYGLGLAIARRAVEAHGGHIYAQNKQEGGLKVTIALPIFHS